MYTYLRDRKYYEDIYDHITVDHARRNMEGFEEIYRKWFETMPDEKPDSHRSVFNLNWIYMLMVGSELVERHDQREPHVDEMIVKDEAKDRRVAAVRLTHEPVCEHCGKTGLRITDKMLHTRNGFDNPEEVLFMLSCPSCSKNTATWEDGTVLERHKTFCPKCKAVMNEKNSRRGNVITTTYTCQECGYSYKEKMDYGVKEEAPDPTYEHDKSIYCLTDEKILQEHRDGKWRLEGMIQLGKEWKEKEENKHVYDAVANLKKPKIAEITPLLAPALEEANYIEFSLDKPEIDKHVIVGFNCLDGKSGREDYESRKTLKKLIDTALKDTNWRLMADGISYRLGYLSGRIRAYEGEEDMKKLVTQIKGLKQKSLTE